MTFSVNNVPKGVGRIFLEKATKMVLAEEQRQEEVMEIVFLSRPEIKKLNQQYRKKNRPTDVLSFAGEGKADFPLVSRQPKLLGQIAICWPEVAANAANYGILSREELTRVLVHGILHLLGYDHEANSKQARQMAKKQEEYVFKALSLR